MVHIARKIIKIVLPEYYKEEYSKISEKHLSVLQKMEFYFKNEQQELEKDPEKISPYAFTEYRVKNLESAVKKFFEKNYTVPSIEELTKELDDIYGVRVIVYSKREVYAVSDFIEEFEKKHPEIFRVQPWSYKHGAKPTIKSHEMYEKDYIRNSKTSGYRSLHLKTEVKDHGEWVQVEIQIRSLLMHIWSRVDHVIRYSKNRDDIVVEFASDITEPVVEEIVVDEPKQDISTAVKFCLTALSDLLDKIDDFIGRLYDKNGLIEKPGAIERIATLTDAIKNALEEDR